MQFLSLAILIIWCLSSASEGRRFRTRNFAIDSFSTVHHLYWNSSNHLFDRYSNSIRSEYNERDADYEAPTLNVRLLDALFIHCPQYTTKQFEDLSEQSLIYMVSKQGFEGCFLDDTARLIAHCSPSSRSVIRRIFRRKGSAFGKLVSGNDYFLISTSSGTEDGLYQSRAGLCAAKNLRIKIHIENGNFGKTNSIALQPIYFIKKNDVDDEKANMLEDGTDEIFMTEEYNELTWKKKIIDPRVPESERNFGGKVISSLPKEIAQREHIKFSTMQHVDQPIIADQHNTNGNKQHHLLSANDDTSHDNNINNNEFYSNLMQAQDNPSADEYNFKSSEQLEFTKTEEFDGDFPEVGTMEIMRLDDSDSDPSKYNERGFTLMFYDRPSELEIRRPFPSSATWSLRREDTFTVLMKLIAIVIINLYVMMKCDDQ